MSTPTSQAATSAETSAEKVPSLQDAGASSTQPAIESELLIEEISIDGMCGVY